MDNKEAIVWLKETKKHYGEYHEKADEALDIAIKALEEKPQGEWKFDDTEQFCYCSNCEDTYYPRPLDPSWYYCPHCGAKMENG